MLTKTKFITNFFLSVLFISLTGVGCASIKKSSPELDQNAKKFTPLTGKANIYIFRDELLGGAVSINVDIDGTLIGTTAAKTFLLASVYPGKHVIHSNAENESVLEVETQKNKNYFIWQEVKMGILFARNKLQQVTEENGKSRIKECSLIGQ